MFHIAIFTTFTFVSRTRWPEIVICFSKPSSILHTHTIQRPAVPRSRWWLPRHALCISNVCWIKRERIQQYALSQCTYITLAYFHRRAISSLMKHKIKCVALRGNEKETDDTWYKERQVPLAESYPQHTEKCKTWNLKWWSIFEIESLSNPFCTAQTTDGES